MSRRISTAYPGVFYREVKRVGGPGREKVYYILFKKDGRLYEEKAGRQYVDAMTPARAAGMRTERIEGKRLSRKELRELKKAEESRWTVSRLWKEYKRSNPKLKGLATDENRFKKYIASRFGGKEPKDIPPLDIDRLKIRLLKTRTPGTVKNVLELLRRIVNYGVKMRLCGGLEFKIRMPKVDNEKTEDLTTEQLANLLKAINEDTHPQAGSLMKMALFTGMRRGELFKLKWKDIDFEHGFINIEDPKGGKAQKIPLNGNARDLLAVHLRISEFVFPGRNGRQRTDIKKQVNSIKKKAGLPKDFRPLHGLRHVYASMLASSGKVDMYTLQELLTHKSPLMTQRYAHLQDEALGKAAKLAGDMISQVIEAEVVAENGK